MTNATKNDVVRGRKRKGRTIVVVKGWTMRGSKLGGARNFLFSKSVQTGAGVHPVP
jgi:hypothetical protein